MHLVVRGYHGMERRKGTSIKRVQVPLGNPFASSKRTAALFEHEHHNRGRHGFVAFLVDSSGSQRSLKNLPGRTATLKDSFSFRCYRRGRRGARRRWNAGLGIGRPLDGPGCGDAHCFCGDVVGFCLVLRGFATGDGAT